MVKLHLLRGPIEDEPQILSFAQLAPQFKRHRIDAGHLLAQRGRLELHHRSCPSCSRITVDPVELNDGMLNRNGAVVPGTSTIVGFHCNACGHEWPI